MKNIQIALLGFLLPILCLSQVSEIKFNTQSIDFSLPPRTNISPMSIKLMDNYNFVGAPTAYGSILEIYGKAGHQTSQLYFGGWDNSKIRYREAFYNQNTWSSWITLLDSKNIVESDGVLKIKGTGNSSILGNLGIGTATPNAKLEVNGDTKINGVLNVLGSNALNFSTYGGGFYMSDTSWIRTSGNKNFYHNAGVMRTDGVFHVGPNGDRLVVDANGKVGIGTATPASKLDVMGNYSEVSLNANSLATANFRTAGVVQIAISTSGIAPYTTSLQTKHTSFNGITYPIALNPLGGNVGIGTTDPKAKLHIFGQENGAFNGLVVDNRKNYGAGSGISQTSRIVLSLTENGVPNPLDRIFGIIESGTLSESSSADGRLSFYVRQGGSVNEKLRINSIGDVGIGTTSPTAKLEVNGNTKINGVLNVIGSNALNFSTYGGGFYMSDTSWIRTSGNKNFYHNTGVMRTDGVFHVGPNGDRFVVNTNGFVGIGTTTPTANLEVFKNLSKSVLKISNSDPASLNTELRLGGNNTFEKSAIISAPNPAGWWRQDLYFCLANGNNNSSATISDAAMVIKSYKDGQFGNVGIGTTNPDQKLTVKGKIHTEEVIVDLLVPADYVFQKYYTGKSELKADYKLRTLAEIEDFTKQNHHLPNVPSAAAIQEKGLQLGEMSNVLLQKVEELTIYAIEQDKKIIEQDKKAALQQQELELLKTQVKTLLEAKR